MIDLRPCPFCGNNVRLEDREFDDFAGSFFTNTMFVIECEKCEISMKRYPKQGYGTTDEQKQDLINSWNRRTEALMLKEQEAVEPFHRCIDKDFTLIEDSHFDYCPYCGKPITWAKQEGR